jgi:histidinol-phosphate aminotransferase
MLDFAVNVRAVRPPSWLVERLGERLGDLGRYPSESDQRRATDAVAARHGRRPEHVLPLAGGAEGFAMLARLRPRLAALVAPSFTEPEAVFTAAGIPIHHVEPEAPFTLSGAVVPDEADLVDANNIAVRRCDTFVGFDGQYLRAAVRPEWPTLVEAMTGESR